MRCPCLEHGGCPIEHLEQRVAALEQQRDSRAALEQAAPDGYCPKGHMLDQDSEDTPPYCPVCDGRPEQAAAPQPLCVCGHPREWHLKDGQLDVCFTEGCKCIKWQPRSRGGVGPLRRKQVGENEAVYEPEEVG